MATGFIRQRDINEDSLISGALYFDRLVVLTPGVSDESTYPLPPLPTSVRCERLLNGLVHHGIVRKIQLSRDDKRRAASALVDAVRRWGEELRGVMKFDGLSPAKGMVRTFGIYNDFIPDTLREAVLDEGIGSFKKNLYQMWDRLLVASNLGRIYYSMLLDDLARTNLAEPMSVYHSPLVGAFSWTDDTLHQTLLRPDGQLPTVDLGRDLSALLGMASVRAVLPAASDRLSADVIVGIRSKHRAELIAFQNYMQQVSTGSFLSGETGVINADALQEILAVKYEREVYPGIVELQKSLKQSRLNACFGVISTQAAMPPIAAAAISEFAGGNNMLTAVATGAGFAFGISQSAVRTAGELRGLRQASTSSYLLAVRSESLPRGFRRLKRAGPPSHLEHGTAALPK
ncbi:hypothetical protein AB0B94_00520 [Micromonospora sp. NPDC048986]|uniref:hypothetical protein n=1 Tax=Micromonospora sp. NPDC048986 TaxID=3155644 RepID=UPI00340EDD54